MPIPLLLATTNRGKRKELETLFAGLDLQLLLLSDVENPPTVIEDGETFSANASKKATVLAEATGLLTLADDSGLEVDALGGEPGVFSARYAGEGATDAANNAKLLRALAHLAPESRTARFRCVLALADPRQTPPRRAHLEEGVCEGRIADAPRGDRGFGYDPLFLPLGSDRTFAEFDAVEKNANSHRAAAAKRMRAHLERLLAGASSGP